MSEPARRFLGAPELQRLRLMPPDHLRIIPSLARTDVLFKRIAMAQPIPRSTTRPKTIVEWPSLDQGVLLSSRNSWV